MAGVLSSYCSAEIQKWVMESEAVDKIRYDLSQTMLLVRWLHSQLSGGAMSGARAQSGEQDETLRQLAEAALRDEESWARLVHAEEEALARALPPGLPAPLRPKPSTPPQELTLETLDARRAEAVATEPSVITETGQPPAGAAPRPPSTPTLQPPRAAATTTPRPPSAKLDLTGLFGDKGRTPRAESRGKVDDLFSGQAGGLLLGSSSARGTQPARKGGSLFGDADDPLFSALLPPK